VADRIEGFVPSTAGLPNGLRWPCIEGLRGTAGLADKQRQGRKAPGRGLLRNPVAGKRGLSKRSVGGTTDRFERPVHPKHAFFNSPGRSEIYGGRIQLPEGPSKLSQKCRLRFVSPDAPSIRSIRRSGVRRIRIRRWRRQIARRAWSRRTSSKTSESTKEFKKALEDIQTLINTENVEGGTQRR
jgi:hypothetical protein